MKARKHAREAAAALFIDGRGVAARRLVMERHEGQFNESEWGESVVAAHIEAAIRAAERRGEQRVLGWMGRNPAVPAWRLTREYHKARRARARGKR